MVLQSCRCRLHGGVAEVLAEGKQESVQLTLGDEQERVQVPVATAVEDWVVSFRPSNARPPLFCVISGGDDKEAYGPFAEAFPDCQPVYIFRLPAIDDIGQTLTVEKLASIYLAKIRALQSNGPYNLCGYSFGGLVVYEIACLLRNAGADTGLVGMIDTVHPRLAQNLPIAERTAFWLVYLTDRVTKYARNLRRGQLHNIVSDIIKFIDGRVKELFRRVLRVLFHNKQRRIPGVIKSSEYLIVTAWRSYVPREYEGSIVLFQAAVRGAEYRRDPTLGWKASASGAIDTHVVPGNHTTLLQSPNVHALAELIMPYLVAATERDRN